MASSLASTMTFSSSWTSWRERPTPPGGASNRGRGRVWATPRARLSIRPKVVRSVRTRLSTYTRLLFGRAERGHHHRLVVARADPRAVLDRAVDLGTRPIARSLISNFPRSSSELIVSNDSWFEGSERYFADARATTLRNSRARGRAASLRR